MKLTKTKARADVRAVEDKLEELKQSALQEPQVVKARQALRAANDQYDQLLRAARERLRPQIQQLEADLWTLRETLRDVERAAKLPVPARLAGWLQAIRNGTDYGPVEFRVRWVSKDARFAIITWPGHNFWSSRTDPNAYAATTHWLVDLDKWNPKVKENGSRIRSDCTVAEHEGRLTKNILEDWQKNVDLVYRK